MDCGARGAIAATHGPSVSGSDPRPLLTLLLAEPGVWTAKRAAEHLEWPVRRTQREVARLARDGWQVHRAHDHGPITLTHPNRPDLTAPPAQDAAAQARAELADLRRQIREARETLAELDRRVQEHEFQQLALERRRGN